MGKIFAKTITLFALLYIIIEHDLLFVILTERNET